MYTKTSQRDGGVEHGHYRAQCSGQLYTYDFIWLIESPGCSWEAIIKRDGRLVGKLQRQIADCHGLDPFTLATAELHYAIEHSIEQRQPAAENDSTRAPFLQDSARQPQGESGNPGNQA